MIVFIPNLVCLLLYLCIFLFRKTFKYGGRKMAPSIDEITAISAGRNSKRQIYRLPGGTERVINTKSTTVVDDIVEELCKVIGKFLKVQYNPCLEVLTLLLYGYLINSRNYLIQNSFSPLDFKLIFI